MEKNETKNDHKNRKCKDAIQDLPRLRPYTLTANYVSSHATSLAIGYNA